MTLVERSFEQLRRANPEPDPVALRRELRDKTDPVTDNWRIDMDNLTLESEPKTPLRNPRRWAPAMVTAAIALLVGVPLLIYVDRSDLFGAKAPTPVEIVESYMEARNAHDAVAMRELLAESVDITDDPPYGLEELEMMAELESIAEFQFSPYSCHPYTPEVLDGWVRCTYTFQSRHQRVIDYPNVEGDILFATEDGKITLISHIWSEEWNENAAAPFGNFLETEGVADQIYRQDLRGPRLTAEALELYRLYFQRYEEFVGDR